MIERRPDLAATHRTIVSSRPNRKTNCAVVVGKTGTTIGAPPGAVADDEAAVDEADEQDEQADADADRPLQRQRDGVHDRLAEADERRGA